MSTWAPGADAVGAFSADGRLARSTMVLGVGYEVGCVVLRNLQLTRRGDGLRFARVRVRRNDREAYSNCALWGKYSLQCLAGGA